jgi:putative YphP/YqiW family bacilliredoxin
MFGNSLIVQPMRDEVTGLGVRELLTADAVEEFVEAATEPSLVFVNSVCGCAAGNARPALSLALRDAGDHRPARLATVFAGQDPEPTARFRELFPEIPASSPAVYLLKSRKVVHHVPRHRIEGRSATEIAGELIGAFAEHC